MFVGNMADVGGGLSLGGAAHASLHHCTFVNSRAKFSGAGVDVDIAVVLDLSFCTLANNTSVNQGAGIAIQGRVRATLRNALCTNNTAVRGGCLYVALLNQAAAQVMLLGIKQ